MGNCFSDALQEGASQFEKSAATLKRKYWWKNCKMIIIICAIVTIIIIIIVGKFIMITTLRNFRVHIYPKLI